MTARLRVFRGGPIITADPRRPRARALAIRDERIVALDDSALRLADEAEVEDLSGGTLLPGFRDGHLHPLWGGTEQLDAPVADATSLDDLLTRVRRHAEAHPDEPWVLGHGYPCELLPSAMGDAALLDRAVPERPVALWASDHHTLWVNSAALAVTGIDARTADPPRGQIVRDAHGQPTGMLLEAAMDLVTAFTPRRGPADKAKGLRSALTSMRACGIVAGQEAALAPDDVAVYLDVEAEGALTASIDLALRTDPAAWRAQREAFRAVRQQVEQMPRGASPGQLSCTTVKVFADGVIESGTGALLEPYVDAPHSCGIASWDADELRQAACAFDEDGFELHIHAIGDAAIRMALDTVAEVRRRGAPRDRRPVVAHTQLVHPDDVQRFAELGVTANFEPLWAQQSPVMTELTEPRLGPERSARQYPIATLLRTGARVSFGSDWPVSSMVPLEGIATAMTRQTTDGEPPEGWTPEERVPLDVAVHAYTRAVALQMGHHDAGALVDGARADLCVVDAALDSLEPAQLPAADVATVWVGGQEVFRR